MKRAASSQSNEGHQYATPTPPITAEDNGALPGQPPNAVEGAPPVMLQVEPAANPLPYKSTQDRLKILREKMEQKSVLSVDFNAPNITLIAEALRTNTSITSLALDIIDARSNIEGHENKLQLFSDLIRDSKSLRHLSCNFSSSGNLSVKPLAEALAANTSIVSLSLCNAREWQIMPIAKGLHHNQKLAALSLIHPILDSTNLAESICTLFCANPRLTSFTLDDPELDLYHPRHSRSMTLLSEVEAIYHLPGISTGLTQLALSNIEGTTQQSIAILADSLQQNGTLQTLHLGCAELPAECFAKLVQTLKNNAALRDLSFSLKYDTHFNEPYACKLEAGQLPVTKVTSVVRAIEDLPQLTALELCINQMNGIPVESDSLKKLLEANRLQKFALRSRVAVVDFAQLCATIAASATLRELALMFSKEMAGAVVSLVSKTSRLEVLDLAGSLSSNEAGQLAAAFAANTSIIKVKVNVSADKSLDLSIKDNAHLIATAQQSAARNTLLKQANAAGAVLSAMVETLPNDKPELPLLPPEIYAQIAEASALHLSPEEAQRVFQAFSI